MENRRDQAFHLFKRYQNEVGFLVREQLDEYALYTVDRDGDVVGAALADHGFENHTLVHALVVADRARGHGVASSLVDDIARDSPHSVLTGKCRVGLSANDFYRKTGWEKQRETGDGKMNVWKYTI